MRTRNPKLPIRTLDAAFRAIELSLHAFDLTGSKESTKLHVDLFLYICRREVVEFPSGDT